MESEIVSSADGRRNVAELLTVLLRELATVSIREAKHRHIRTVQERLRKAPTIANSSRCIAEVRNHLNVSC